MGKTLIVTGRSGNRTHKSIATLYREELHDEIYRTCVSDIHKQIDNSDVHEMKSSFTFSFEIVEEK